MITRDTKTIYGKPRKGKKAKGVGHFKVHDKFEEMLLQAESDFAREMEKRAKPRA